MNQVLTVEQNEQKEMLVDRIAYMHVYVSRDQCRPLGGLVSTADAATKSWTGVLMYVVKASDFHLPSV